ncbi:MAG TPA: MlaD family protein [Solirubrobacteraceae bacterium]|nr:MlaD family protein [Solirubrobacteraceae bacterium]
MNNRRRSSLAASPLLIGAVTTLIVVVAVFLSFNANNGLPFVPTYNIKVELPEASGLQSSNQVRIAGTRVGIVSGLSPHENPRTGRVTAIATLHLEKKFEPLPANTKAVVQSVSDVGLKYLELEKGDSRAKLKPGQTIPLAQTREPVDIDELFDMFDKPTRTAIKINTNNFGDGLAGRGLNLNDAIHELRPLVTKAIPVLHNLAAPQTGLHALFVDLDRAASQTAPVAQQNAELFSNLDTFFKAWAEVAPSLEAANRGGPASLEQAIYSLPHEAPFYENAAEFMRLLHPSASALRTVAPQLGHAFSVGAVNLAAATTLNTRLAESSKALEEFAHNPIVSVALENFAETLEIGNPLLAGIAPEQADCNYWTLAFRNLASLESEDVGVGTLLRASTVLSPTGVNNEGYAAGGVAKGPSIERSDGGLGAVVEDNFLHYNPYPNVTGPGQADVCEAGNEEYAVGKTEIGHAPKSEDNREFTSRDEDLSGEKYPKATLEALGLVKPKPAHRTPTKPKSKSKGKGR